ncbi:MAG: sigma-70 family RNA polymerase sigma factor [Planctomycetes bacterium]|nr:sigma-70 family RNA polymerase sigma factor [Planctomycetota bacterium]
MATAHVFRLGLFSSDVPKEEAADRSEEIALLRRAQAGDQDAFSEVVNRHWKRAFWTAYDVLYDHDRAQDVAQEAFVKVHKALQSYDLGRDFASWLYRIVLNLAIDHKRRMERDRTVPTDKVEDLVDARKAVAEDDEKAATIERVEQVLRDMPEAYRIPLTMKDIDGLSVEEVARILDLSYSTVRWRLHRARSLFRERWTRLLRREER